MEELRESGFQDENISTETMLITPEAECRYYQHHLMIAPTLIKT